MLILALAVLFFIPATYIAKSKGYKAFPIIGWITALGVILELTVFVITEVLYPLVLASAPLLSFLVIWFLPEKGGAPGKQYLKISFDCPECNEGLIFSRSKEGRAELCPKCNEIITIPTDEFSSKPSLPTRVKPDIESGYVCYASFGDEMLALQMQALLEDNEIGSEIIDGTGGGSLPLLSGTQGFKIAINIEDWDKAVEIEKNASRELEKISLEAD
jgi:hypothetical protein